MLRLIGRVLALVFGTLVFVLIVAAVMAQFRWKRTFEAPTPQIHASADSSVIAYGRYLAYGPAACVGCHVSNDEIPAVREGATPPLAGGQLFDFPLGKFYTPNLTSDPATGIAGRTDGQIARIIRHGVRHDGRAALPFMEYQNISDQDLTALVSFVRSQAPVHRVIPEPAPSFLGKALLSYAIAPIGPSGPPPATSPQGPTVERGEYLANHLSMCTGCHTNRNHMDGSFIGLPFGGGMTFPDETNPRAHFVSPNLTPAKSAPFAVWDEQRFVDRLKSGTSLPNSPMPWRAYSRMSEDDMRAIFRFLRTLEPSEVEVGPSYVPGPA